MDGYLRYYMHISNPEKLNDADWADNVQILHYIRKQEEKASNIKF